MARKRISEKETERGLKAYFQSEAGRLRAPADLWARLEHRLEEAPGEGWYTRVWRWLTSPKRRVPLPAVAGLVALLLVVTGAWLLNVVPGLGTAGQASPAPVSTSTSTPMPASPYAYPTPTPVPASPPPEGRIDVGDEGPAGPAGPAGAPGPAGARGPEGPRGPSAAPTPVPTPAPRPAPTPAAPPPPSKEDESAVLGQVWAAQRMVIRNGTLSLIVEDTARAIEQATQLTDDMGGYVVSSRTWQEGKKVAGTITLRVPAELFSDAVRALKAMAVEVITEDASSQDVTEEHVDLSSRLRSLEATEGQLLKLVERATNVEQVLSVQRELTKVQQEMEQTKGRMQYLEQSSATSLVRLNLQEVGLDINIDVSARRARVGEEIRFSARVAGGFPPYAYRWDLGDGTIGTEESLQHAYRQTGRFDVSLTITDDKGNTATETRKMLITVEPMEARFDASRTEVQVGEEVRFAPQVFGGFPPYSYEWDLGDGTTSAERSPHHSYVEAGRYTVSLSVSDGEGNTASETKKMLITVTEPSGWNAGDKAAGAFGALSTLGGWLGTGLIWTAVFIPVWVGIIGLVIVAAVLRRRLS